MSSKPPDKSVFQNWLESLKTADPPLYKELSERLQQRVVQPKSLHPPGADITLEAIAEGADLKAIALETIVREGRPALLIKENRISQEGKAADAAAQVMVNRLMAAAPVVEPLIPLVGRIDVDNYPGPLPYAGTGWLVGREDVSSIVITNRHVAQLIAQAEDGKFVFRPGRFGEDMRVSLDYRHEHKVSARAVVRVKRVIWIEPDEEKADLALLEVERRGDGTTPEFIPLSDADAAPNNDVVVIGYPARAPAHIIPDQAWMDRIYGSTYDVKRVAPGLSGANSRGWATHDCTTLGGNSGSVVADMRTGKAVALHFAGAYMIENYAVPASVIKQYLKDRPWHGERPAPADPITPVADGGGGGGAPQQPQQPSQGGGGGSSSGVETTLVNGQVTVTIPLTVTVSLGAPQPAGQSGQTTTPPPPPAVGSGGEGGDSGPLNSDEAARALRGKRRVEGVYSVWGGYKIDADGSLSDTECLVVSAHPARLGEVRSAMPSQYAGFPVEVRPASASEMALAAGITEAAASIKYNDDDRTGPEFSFDWVEEEMTVTLHVGPERSWTVLSDFLGGTKRELISSMYEFHAEHIAEAVAQELAEGVKMTLVLANQSRDPKSGQIKEGDFNRRKTFERWEESYLDGQQRPRFRRVFVPLGQQGLVAKSYHIKVTVRDGTAFWLSSGNWKGTSQPRIAEEDFDDLKAAGDAGNREWHVVVENETLARRFRSHILADYQQSHKLGGTPESVGLDEPEVDVPRDVLEAVTLEKAPSKLIEPKTISRRVRVKPLLTPDKEGAVFSQAVLRLIRSAERQLLFQNQYISMSGADGGFLKQLVDALVEKSKELEDFRMILRSENDDLAFDLSRLKKRGIKMKKGQSQVKIMAKTHTKGIVVDGKLVLLGSQNWSGLGVSLNRDASLIFDDEEVAQYYAEAFEEDWNRAREPTVKQTTSESVILAESAAPPRGYVRMSLADYLEG